MVSREFVAGSDAPIREVPPIEILSPGLASKFVLDHEQVSMLHSQLLSAVPQDAIALNLGIPLRLVPLAVAAHPPERPNHRWSDGRWQDFAEDLERTRAVRRIETMH